MWVQKSNLFSRELQLWTLVGLFVLVPTSSNVLCDLYTRIGVGGTPGQGKFAS